MVSYTPKYLWCFKNNEGETENLSSPGSYSDVTVAFSCRILQKMYWDAWVLANFSPVSKKPVLCSVWRDEQSGSHLSI